jgi:hypothetical protein
MTTLQNPDTRHVYINMTVLYYTLHVLAEFIGSVQVNVCVCVKVHRVVKKSL